MKKILVVAAALHSMVSASQLFMGHVINLYATNSAKFEIALDKEKGRYTVDVNASTVETVNRPFLISLHSSQTLINSMQRTPEKKGCLLMKGEICEKGSEKCKKTEPASEADYLSPYFKGKGEVLTIPEFVADGSAWKLATGNTILAAQQCDTDSDKVNVKMFNGTDGILGFGIDGGNKSNFVSDNKYFTVEIDKESKLNLQFKKGDEDGKGQTVWSSKTTTSWKVEPNVTEIKLKDEILTDSAMLLKKINIIFDLNVEHISMSSVLYNRFLAAFSKNHAVTCDNTTRTAPKCNNTVKATDLKNIEIKTKDDKVKINIKPADYVIDAEKGGDLKDPVLSLNSLSVLESGVNHVTKEAEEEVYIILGRRYLQNYVTSFNIDKTTITVREKEVTGNAGRIAFWIGIFFAIFFVVACLCGCFFCGGTAWILSKLGKKDKQDNYYQSSQTDPFVARK